jgi:cytoskeletal protein RodZ
MVKNLWKLDRSTQSDSPGGGTSPSQPADSSYQTVGETLRQRREERGEDLRYVAQMLRIRYPYLKAIEDGRPDELPGPTYAVGFVRTYADHLGLDSEKLVNRFKIEAAGLQTRADLHFPAPLPEGKIPSGAVLVIAVVLAAVVYGAWIYMSSQDQQVAEIVPQLPNRISEIIKGKPAGQGAAAPAPAASSAPSVAANTPSAPPVQDKRPAAAAPEPAAAAPSSAATPDTASAANAPSTPQQPASSGSMPDVSATTDSSESELPPVPSEVPSDQLAMRTDGQQPEASAGAASTLGGMPQPKVYGTENSSARIVIHAAADSWVEVRDSKSDELLLTRVLFKGDSYRVPDRAGLTLLTGNAGGLRIAVDGEDAPSIGALGAVRRNVLLEPGPLKSGKAIGDGGAVRGDSVPPFSTQ